MESYVGAIFSFGFNYAPYGWELCNGQLLPISQNEALFALIGTTFGGDGSQTFGLPNLQGRVPVGQGQGAGLPNYVIGQAAGNESVTLITNNIPVHTHSVLTANLPVAARANESADPNGNYFGGSSTGTGAAYSPATNAVMATNSGNTASTGSGIPMNVMSPFQVVNYCIAIVGIFPSRN